MPSALAKQALAFRMDVYGANVPCVGDGVAPGTTPLSTQSWQASVMEKLSLPAGQHTLVLTAFSDAGATILLAEACAVADVSAASTDCLQFPLHMAAYDMGCFVGDLACHCATDKECTTDAPHCSKDRQCVQCLADTDCPPKTDVPNDGGASVATKCDPTQHTCVQCLTATDCALGSICMDGVCHAGCDTTAGRGCPTGQTCCAKLCVDTKSDAGNCGACGMACGGTKKCCAATCSDTSADINNCGACGTVCGNKNGTPSCTGGTCQFKCASGFVHCGTGTSGCESSLSATTSCSACGVSCDTTNASMTTCDGTTCGYTCKAGFADCMKNAPDIDGCETPTNTALDCGGCGNTCDVLTASQTSCSGKTCQYSCKPGLADCKTTPPNLDGCESDLKSPATCGSCTNACDTKTASAATCDGATCSYTCNAGLLDCTKTGANLDGCETNGKSVTSCGACGAACDTTTTTNPSCDGTHCIYGACTTGRLDCNASKGANTDGCECTSPSCCGTSCQTKHDLGVIGGLASAYYDCRPTSTFDLTAAAAACTAYAGTDPDLCWTTGCGSNLIVCTPLPPQKSSCTTDASCGISSDGKSDGNKCVNGICSANPCICWEYSGNAVGHVNVSTDGTCYCAGSTDPTWN